MIRYRASLTNTPVLLIAFNRPDTTRQVLGRTIDANVRELFIAADGPRVDKPDDVQRCEQTRRLFEHLPSTIRVHKLFHERNLGCRVGVSTAISWFFSHVERGIILEDDCLPDPSFFGFCEAGLRKYESEERIKIISGQNPLGDFKANTDVLLSKFAFIWGWASWRRVWAQYDLEIVDWPSPKMSADITQWLSSKHAVQYWFHYFDAIKRGLDTWDVQLNFLMYKSRGLAAISRGNLVRNIGFLCDATHTSDPDDVRQFQPVLTASSEPVFPARMVCNEAFDRALVKEHYFNKDLTLLGKIKSRLRPIRRFLVGPRG